MLQKRARSPVNSRKAIALFLFRRDLRVEDNLSLYHLLSQTTKTQSTAQQQQQQQQRTSLTGLPILPCFFFLPQQADPTKNPYFSNASFQFLKESLADLNTQLEGSLLVLRAPNSTATTTTATAKKKSDTNHCSLIEGEKHLLTTLLHHFDVQAIAYSAGDYSPFARRRDEELNQFVKSLGIAIVQPTTTATDATSHVFASEYTLLPLDTMRTGQGKPYSVFTPFYKKFLDGGYAKQVPKPVPLREMYQQLHCGANTKAVMADDGAAEEWFKKCLVPSKEWPQGLLDDVGVSDPTKKNSTHDSILKFSYVASDRGRGTDYRNPVIHGGRSNALLRLNVALPTLTKYSESRDLLLVPFCDEANLEELKNTSSRDAKTNSNKINESTSLLSAYMKFGCVSVREVFHTAVRLFGLSSVFVKELLWREFYAMLVWHQPSLLHGQLTSRGVFLIPQSEEGNRDESSVERTTRQLLEYHNQPFQEVYQSFEWRWQSGDAAAFFEGRTGVPLVDAAVRCLRTTGFCPNRLRMVLAIVATKNFGIDWRICEQFYASHAVDYDPSSNSGGWQWASGQGADALPYFRTMSPYIQAKKFDPNAQFVQHFVSELKEKSVKEIQSVETGAVGKRLKQLGGDMKGQFEIFRSFK